VGGPATSAIKGANGEFFTQRPFILSLSKDRS
jgi:hypothetical protein